MQTEDYRTVIAAIIIQDKKVLLVRKEDWWIFPGGKLEKGESDLECLAREIEEELPGTEINLRNAWLYHETWGISPITKKPAHVKMYIAQAYKIGSPSQEIKDAAFVGRDDIKHFNIPEQTKDGLSSLISRDYI